ncbi:MAG: 2-oxo acid dehydrogenase subunit E2 [Thermoplasmata archaeon]|uniref:2-oxo acid dehydrogenase subunit E2 n=1 Tax=Candidatus Sysuiplasma superficiale TaxID=2823368 RepID=A0A8J7YPL2_9ARCH|nr:2-oxo acid dehydrogenase subunit E2 [Candidatus Sysuiplasma superficiale]MBX8644568.1 2-oxo acid dehydrogenase subunit E2 [Candidatus Sysuiplasma superficiale]
MRREFKLPDVGEGVAEGEIKKWLVKEGERVKEFQPLAEIITDKVNVEMTSPFTGTILKLRAAEGQTVKVGEPILEFEAEEDRPVAETHVREDKSVPAQTASTSPVTASAAIQASVPRATPAVRKRARELGIDLSSVRPGPDGRVTLADLERIASSRGARTEEKREGGQAPGREDRVRVHGIRKRIFERMAESKRNIPHFSYVDEADMTNIINARNILSKKYGEGVKLTYLPFIIKAVVEALKEFPYLNSSYDQQKDEIVLKHYYNIGIAVATDDGLVVPNIKDADTKTVEQIAREVDDLASRARSGKLVLSEVQGGTFTITNVGPIGGLFSTPVINYPESAILATHKIQQRPVARNGQIVIRDMMYFTVACDHRIVDGAVAAMFGNRLIEYLEHPFLMKLEF